MYKALIVEDDPFSSDILVEHLEKNHSSIDIVGTAGTIAKAILLYIQYKPNIVLLDIQIGEELCFALFEEIDLDNTTVIFMSSYQEYALKSIKYRPFGYLLKPLNIVELDKTLIKLIQYLEIKEENKYQKDNLRINSKDKVYFIPFNSIQYIEADGAYSKIVYKNELECLSSINLKQIENRLPQNNFIRIHSKYIVNKKQIVSINKTQQLSVELANKTILPISRRRLDYVMQRLN